uniref:Protein TOPAZ1 n=1 Tax=Timema poppense TaxID=170557 RepID=A0A7R9CXI5_TIMPO|nr:unnamed protein product [Timema poppensis]
MTREIDEVKSLSKISSEAEVDSKKVVTHSHDVIVDKEIGDYLQRRSRRRLASTSSSDSRISMSRDIDEVESLSKMSFEAEVDSKKVVTHSHDAIVDKEIGDYLQRRSRRRLASTSSSDSRISMSRDIDEVESLSKISSPVSLTKPKITRKLNFPYQQTNLNVAEVKHLDFNQIDLCNTPESISNNSSTTSKINAPSILDDDEEKHLCHETEANTYKSIQLVSTYDSDQVNTTMPAQKQNVVFKVLQTPASQSVVGETPSSICEDISLKSSKSAEALGSDQATSKLKQNLVRVEKHRVSPSTLTSMSNPVVSGNLRNDPTSEDNESDEDLDAISLFAETDIGFEQRPAEVHPKNMHPDNPLARSDSDSDISDNSDNESRPLMLPVPDFINYLNKEKENHQTVTNIPLNDEVDSNEDFPRWRSDIYQECDQSSGNENDGSECSVEVPFRVELDSHNPPSVTAEDRLDTYDDAHGMPEEGELETENENKCFAEEEDNLEDMRYNGTANIDSPNLPDKAAEQHCETNIAHYDDMSGYLMQHGNREDVNLMGYQSPSQHSSSSCRKPQEGRFCFTFLKYGNCKKYPHNCTYNHWVPHLSLYAPIEAGNYLSFTYSKGFNYASNSVLKSLIKEIIDQNETNMDRNDQELWDILVKILKGCDLRNKLQINRSSSASSQERSPHDKPTTAHAELSTQHNNRNTNMRRLTRQGKQPSPLDSIPDQTDHILHSQNITRVPKLNNSNPHNVHLSKANILSNATFQERSSDVLDYADTMSSYVRNNEEGFNKPLSYTDDINRTLYNISSAKHPIGNTAIDPKLFCPPGIRAGFNIGVPGVNKYWEDEGYSTNASRLPLPDSSREIFQNIPPLSNFSTQRPFEFQGKYGPNFHCPQRPQLPPPQGPNLPNRVRRRKKQSQTQWNLMQGPPKRNCSPMNEDECRMVFEQEWNFTLKNLKDGDFRSVSARLNSWKSRAERNEFCLRVYQELIRNGESAAPNFRRLVESAVSDSVISLRNDYDLMAMMSSIGMCLLLDLCSKSTWETAYQIHFVMKKYGIDPLISQTEHDATTSQAQKILCCIEVCMNSNHGQDAVDILAAYKLQNPDPNQWQLASNPADVGTRNLLVATLLEGLVESNYIKEARRLFDLLYTAQKCVKKPIDIAKHLNTLLVFLLDANLNVEALNLFLKINQPALPVEVVTYRALLAACVEKHMMKAAETLWRSLGLFGVFSFQEVTYPLVIKMKSYFMKEEIYMELRQYFLQLSKSLCSDQIDANVTECRVNILIEEFPIGEFQRGVKVPLVVKKAELASSYVKVRLKNVLKHDFQIEIDKEWGDNSRLIALKSESVKNYLRKLQFST